LPDSIAYIQAFRQQHFNPQAMVEVAGPDQGSAFTGPVGGAKVAEGIMYPNGWYPKLTTYQNAQMVQDFITANGGTADAISADVAEGYAVGQVLYQAVNKIHSIDNAKIIAELHSGDTFQSVQGDVKFKDVGENIDGTSFMFQWQKGSVVLVYPGAQATASPEFPKTSWP